MASSGSNSPISMEVEEPRKKGSRGGKRSVTHLSKAQLARKRANDREAQRNIRQRTKEHIENLERKVKELEHGSRASSIERVLQRNRELEDEVEKLRAQVTGHHTPVLSARGVVVGAGGQADLQDELLMAQQQQQQQQQKVEWMPEAASCAWPPVVSHIPVLSANPELPASSSSAGQVYPAVSSSMGGGYEDETAAHHHHGHGHGHSHMYTSSAEAWGSPVVSFGGAQSLTTTHSLAKAIPAWSSPIDPTFSQDAVSASSAASRFSEMQMAGFGDLVNQQPHQQQPQQQQQQQQQHQNYSSSTCWQNQPSLYSWQISTKC